MAALLTEDAVLPGLVCRGLKQIHAQEQYLSPNLVLKWIDRMNFGMRINFELKFNLEV